MTNSISSQNVVSPHALHSSLREKVIEHKFISDVLSYLWSKEIYDVEVSKSDIDNAGYDLIITANKRTAHIQLKSSKRKIKSFPVNLRLWEKKNPCVIWTKISYSPEDELQMEFSYYLACLGGINCNLLKTAVNPRGKKPRANIKNLPTSKNFTEVTIPELIKRLYKVN